MPLQTRGTSFVDDLHITGIVRMKTGQATYTGTTIRVLRLRFALASYCHKQISTWIMCRTLVKSV